MVNRREYLTSMTVVGGIVIAGCAEEEEAPEPDPEPEQEEATTEDEPEEQEEPAESGGDESEEEPQEEPQEEEEPEPAEFQLVDLSPGDVSVEYGETIDTEVTIENIGGAEGDVTLEYRVEDETIGEETYTLEGGEQDTISTTFETLSREDGEYEYGFYTENDEVTGTITVTLDEPDPISFSGSGAEVTNSFEIEGGMVIAEWEHSGDRNFIVDLIDATDDASDELLANEIGNVSGVWGQGVPEGEYILDIDADGSWDIEILQPRVTLPEGEKPSYSVSGDESEDWFVLHTEETIRVAATHSGEGNFIVQSYNILGDRHSDTLVFNEIGDFSGETTFSYDLGATFFIIQADGDWSLDFEEL